MIKREINHAVNKPVIFLSRKYIAEQARATRAVWYF